MNKKFILACLAMCIAPLAGCSSDEGSSSQPAAKKYTVTWKDENGNVLETDKDVVEGTVPTFDGTTPTKESSVSTDYTFNGWEPAVTAVSADVTYTVKFSESARKYPVSWFDGNGHLLKTDQVAYGQTPSYSGEAPTKESDNEHNYAFNESWTPSITSVVGEQSYTANFTPSTRYYTVRFVDGDGKELQSSQYQWHETPEYTGETPTKAKTIEKTYTWNHGWDAEIGQVESDKTYTATFDEAPTMYTVKLINSDGSDIKTLDTPVAYNAVVDLSEEDIPNYPDDPSRSTTVKWEEQERDDDNYIRTFKANHTPGDTKVGYLSFTLINDNKEYQVDGKYSGSSIIRDLVIPAEVDGKPVTQIRSWAFSSDTNLRSIHIPASVKTILQQPFYGCTNVESIVIEGSPSIGSYAFYRNVNCKHFEVKGGSAWSFSDVQNCCYQLGRDVDAEEEVEIILGEGLAKIPNETFHLSSVTSVKLPKSLTEIGNSAFMSCERLKTVEFKNNESDLETIGNYAFQGTYELEDFYFGDEVASIDYDAFNSSGIASAILPDGCAVGARAFAHCPNLRNVRIPDVLTFNKIYDDNVFYESGVAEYEVSADNTTMQSIDGVVYSKAGSQIYFYPPYKDGESFKLPDAVTSTKNYAFRGAKNLKTVDLNNVTDLGFGTFKDSSLEEIELPAEMTVLNGEVFMGSKLKEITIPKGVGSIQGSALANCQELTSIVVETGNSNFSYEEDSAILYSWSKSMVYVVGAGLTGSLKLPNTVETVGQYAFAGCQLESLDLNNAITIYSYAFQDSGDIDITFSNIDEIQSYVFQRSGVTHMELPESLGLIRESAFQNAKIEEIAFPKYCERIDSYAFYYCEKLESVTFNNVNFIGYRAFAHSGVKSLNLSSTITSMGMYAFEYSSVEEVTYDIENVNADGVFNKCEKLQSIAFGNTVKMLPRYFCEYCTSLTEIDFNTVEYLGNYCFMGCSSLEEITLPITINGIMNGPFQSCSSLATINYEGTVQDFYDIGAYRDVEGRGYGIINGWTPYAPVGAVTCTDGPSPLYPF